MKLFTKFILLLTAAFMPFLNTAYIQADTTPSTCVQSSQPKTIAIIGGGMAGVAAANFLRNSRYQVHLFESRTKLGGHAQTAVVNNGTGGEAEVDLGPQYFAKGPWDLYIDFLKYFHLYNKEELFFFNGGLTTSIPEHKPYFVAPKLTNLNKILFNLHLDNVKQLYTFYRFNKEAYHFYRTKNECNYTVTAAEWLNKHKFSKKDQDQLLLPFLGSLIGVDNDHAKNLSILALTRLFAFSHPLRTKYFTIPRRGMGEIINTIGGTLEKESSNLTIHRGTFVTSLCKENNQYRIRFKAQDDVVEKEMLVDKVITAAHPQQLVEILPSDDPLIPHLSQFEYVENRIVLHNSDTFDRGRLSSVVDIELNQDKLASLTMNLGKINKSHFGSVCKSWVNDERVYQKMKSTNSILAEAKFKHPYVTPSFVRHRNGIRTLLETNNRYTNLSIAGGWTELTETQATAILSAYKAVKRICPEVTEEQKWYNVLPTLRKLNV